MSCLVTRVTINLFCSKTEETRIIRITLRIKCKVTLVYLEIKASCCFHSTCKCFFSKAIACTITLILYIIFNIQYLIKIKLLFSALVFTFISYIDLYIITDYNNLADGGVRCSYKGGIFLLPL